MPSAKRRRMQAPDLRSGPPRRWCSDVNGVIWLPRLIDKVRAERTGRLGTYLLGQSPVDDAFLAVAGISYARLLAVITEADMGASGPGDAAIASDTAILAGIEAVSPGATARLQAWSLEMPRKRSLHMRVLDIDDGYIAHPRLRALMQRVFAPFAPVIRRWRPLVR